MLQKMRQRTKRDEGFTLIELLVVILIIGILAAIAIPSFLSQKSKASDASAKELARTAQTTVETVATDNNGSYAGVTNPASLKAVEPSINTTCVVGGSAACLSAAVGSSNTWSVTATSEPTTNTYTIARDSAGNVTRSCSPAGSGGCPSNSSW